MFLTVKKIITGRIRIIKIEIDIHIFLHSINVSKNTINNGITNSAKESPNHEVLNALPLLFSKYLDIVVDAVCDIKPCPDNLIKKIAKNKNITDEILENRKLEIDNRITTYDANFTIFMSSIFFPIQTKIKLLKSVADA
tara:strand:+ start:698 stop:1114 length:417 start_codon:yes stop_codon:yes gene_type:complete